MEKEVEIKGERNIELDFGSILCEIDGYDKGTKTATEVKSNFGSKNFAEYRCIQSALLIYALQDLTNSRKIKNYELISINSKITKKYGMDHSTRTYTLQQFKNKELFKVRSYISNKKEFEKEVEMSYKWAEIYLTIIKEVNKKEI